MTFGVRLTGDEKDKATLAIVAQRAPTLVDAPWEEREGEDWVAVFSEKLTEPLAHELMLRGVKVVRDTPSTKKDAFQALTGTARLIRPAKNLLEALRPISVRDEVPAEALFVIPLGVHGAQATVERLLLLDRPDAQIGETELDGVRTVLIRVTTPPLYLLMRARDQQEEGVAAFTRTAGAPRVWCTWGKEHPLAALLDERLGRANRAVIIDGDGRWMFAPTQWDLKPIYESIQPHLEAARDDLKPREGDLAFGVRLRFGPADRADPELWLLDAPELMKLEAFVDTSPAEEVGRLLVSRVAGEDGRARYVLREAVRPQVTRLGPRIAALLEKPGFSRAPALDNLYLPPARRLVPQLHRDQIKELLKLDSAAAVVIEENPDGLRAVTIHELEDAPLTRFTSWVATDHRTELDRILEDAVASFPGVIVEKAKQVVEPKVEEPQREKPAPKSPRERPAQQAAREEAREANTTVAPDVAELRRQIRALEERVLGEGAHDAEDWRRLGVLKGAVEEHDDASMCFEVALFLGGPPSTLAVEMAQSRRRMLSTDPPLLDLVVRERLTRDEMGLLAARVVEAVSRKESVIEDVYQHAVGVLSRDDALISRRMQWASLFALHQRTGDALGATRAKETVLGGLNAKGLSESLDLPRFVRTALALSGGDDDGNVSSDRVRREQLVHLDKLFAQIVPHPTKVTNEGEAFLRAIFAVGIGRLGGRAQEIVRSLEQELDAHLPPIRVLLRLYIARLTHFLTKGGLDGWKKEVDAMLASLARPEERRVVEWLVKRSLWLRATPQDEAPPGLRPALERLLAAAEKRPEDVPGAIQRVYDMPGLYDYEVATAIERMLKGALASGRDQIVEATLQASLKGVDRIRILAHRVRALGTCVRAAATLNDADLVDRCLDGIAGAARSPNVPSIRDLLVAVKPALAALRRLGLADAAARFLASLEPVAQQADKETGPLLAALSDGFLQLGDTDRARALLTNAFKRALQTTTGHVDRYEAGAAILEALTHWDLDARAGFARMILAELTKFSDTFTTSRFFATHQILIAERLVETIADDITLRSDRLQAYLDGEEQGIRRRILAQWSSLT